MNTCKKCKKEFKPVKGLINYCSLECRNSRNWSEEDKNKKSNSAKNSTKVKEANHKICINNTGKRYAWQEKICPICNKSFKTRNCHMRVYHDNCWKTISGGYKQGSSRGKKGWYKGYWCDSSWELAWIIFHLNAGYNFERNTKGFEYEFEGKVHKYYPDFILDNGMYVEIKNYPSKLTDAKIAAFPYPIKVYYKENMQNIFERVIAWHGKDFIQQYE